MRAWDEGLDFRELVRNDSGLSGRLDLDEVFDGDSFVRHADVVFGRLRALASEREEVRA